MMMKRIAEGLVLGLAMALAGSARGEVVATARSPEGEFPEFRVVLDAAGEASAVANFMGLLDGSQAWLDPETWAVRGGAEDAFYKGMVFDWNEGSMVRGGLRSVASTNGGVEYTGGTGYTVKGKGEHSRDAVSLGSLVLLEEGGPHSGGGEIALALTNGTTTWTVFGQVRAGDEAGVRGLAAAVSGGATKVEWSVDMGGATTEERMALEKARDELAVVEGIETHLNAGGPEWEWPGKSRLEISLSTNLVSGWHHSVEWNEGGETLQMSVPWGNLGWMNEDQSIVVLDGEQGFASFVDVRHPKLTGEILTGKWRLGVDHSEQQMQYWLDFDKRTGMWARVESGAITDSGRVTGIRMWRETGNSLVVFFGMGNIPNYYYLGFAEEGARKGRFMSKQQFTVWTEDWGSFQMAEGWGEEAKEVVRRLARRGEGKMPVLGSEAPCGRRKE